MAEDPGDTLVMVGERGGGDMNLTLQQNDPQHHVDMESSFSIIQGEIVAHAGDISGGAGDMVMMSDSILKSESVGMNEAVQIINLPLHPVTMVTLDGHTVPLDSSNLCKMKMSDVANLVSSDVINCNEQQLVINSNEAHILMEESSEQHQNNIDEEVSKLEVALQGSSNHMDSEDADEDVVPVMEDGEMPQMMISAEQLSIGTDRTLAVAADPNTLQSLLASGTAQLTTDKGETIQIITVSHAQNLASAGKLNMNWENIGVDVSQSADAVNDATLLVNQASMADQHEDSVNFVEKEAVVLATGLTEVAAGLLMPPPPLADSPTWAHRLRDCERIGNAYRGWIETEMDLDVLLTYHKQQTQSFWGTRQSPSPAKPSTRLMWKSQYVPFDGIPFINAGSRAIVMECQYGPRRKGNQVKRSGDQLAKAGFRQTCPARIYIKKVRKYIDFAVEPNQDKRCLKLSMDRAFQLLRERGPSAPGQDRFYVQLPTEKEHDFHGGTPITLQLDPKFNIEEEDAENEDKSRLHPSVIQRIRQIVSGGENRLYVVRKSLRKFVEKELAGQLGNIPEKHNLYFFPTVNDLQNQIHQATKDIEDGILPVTAQTVNIEVVGGDDSTVNSVGLDTTMWQTLEQQDHPHAETVTVTLTQNPGEDGQHVISRVETHLSDGSTQVSTNLTPETAQLLAKLHPNMFPSTGHVMQDTNIPITPFVSSPSRDTETSSTLSAINPTVVLQCPSDFAQPGVFELQGVPTDLDDNVHIANGQPIEISMIEENMRIKVEPVEQGEMETADVVEHMSVSLVPVVDS